MSADPSSRSDPGAEKRAAAAWVFRIDRGLTAAEQDDYLRWLRESPDHPAMIAEQQGTLQRLMRLSAWQPRSSMEPNPDLFAPPRTGPRLRWILPIAAAAAVALGFALQSWRDASSLRESHLVSNEERTLPDGSRIVLKGGTAIEVRYSATERRIRLIGGEASFSVRKNPSRPFVVEAAGVAVQAVGTVFDVRLGSASVDVVVTQGKVRVDDAERLKHPATVELETVSVSAGECAIVSLNASASVPQVTRLSKESLNDQLAWQIPRFQFYETPLADAVAEFNRYNRQQLVIGDPTLQSVPIGGTFRADDAAGFAHILEAVIAIRATSDASGRLVLTSER